MATDKAELRQQVPLTLLQVLDAIAMAKGFERHAYVEHILTADVKKVAHEASVIARCMRSNPLMPDSCGGASE